jgi:dTDP-glucose 4,6-dehydratase/UDP-glucuronate decarboxylase
MISRGVDRQRFELLSDGRATRTYGYISDATIGFLLALLSDSNGDVFNIGSDEPETSILELATTISRLFGRTESVQVASSDLPDHLRGAPNRVCPDLTKARTMLGYRPQVTLEDGLRRTVAWHLAKRGLALT